jgi:hypothetical protein
MCPKAIEGRYSLNVRPEESFSLVQKALTELNHEKYQCYPVRTKNFITQ